MPATIIIIAVLQSEVFSKLAPAADVREAAAAVPVVVPAVALPTILIPTVLKQDTYFTFLDNPFFYSFFLKSNLPALDSGEVAFYRILSFFILILGHTAIRSDELPSSLPAILTAQYSR